MLIGTYVLSAGYYDAYYLKALKVRRRIADDFEQAFGKVAADALLTPTAPSAAFGLKRGISGDPIAMYLNDIFTVTVNLAGLPGISVPGGLDAKGLPLGLQLIGRALDEGTLFSLAGALEKAAASQGYRPGAAAVAGGCAFSSPSEGEMARSADGGGSETCRRPILPPFLGLPPQRGGGSGGKFPKESRRSPSGSWPWAGLVEVGLGIGGDVAQASCP